MPDGGSDCCGTCWFNERNKGEAGYAHADDAEPNVCTIRGLAIENAFWTYCLNHPHHRPNRDPIPIGPVFVAADENPYRRERWRASPGTAEIREHLLDLVAAIEEQPSYAYPVGTSCDEIVVWQLVEFRRQRAADDLRRIAAFSPDATAGPLGRSVERLVAAAQEALTKLKQNGG